MSLSTTSRNPSRMNAGAGGGFRHRRGVSSRVLALFHFHGGHFVFLSFDLNWSMLCHIRHQLYLSIKEAEIDLSWRRYYLFLSTSTNLSPIQPYFKDKKFKLFLDLYVSSLCRDHDNLCIIPILLDVSKICHITD